MKFSMDGYFKHLNTLGKKLHIQSSSLDCKIKDECKLTGTSDPTHCSEQGQLEYIAKYQTLLYEYRHKPLDKFNTLTSPDS